jgi:hypothetical protein
MPAPAFQSSASTGTTYDTSFTPAVPSGTVAGDLLVAVGWISSDTLSAPAGWTPGCDVDNGVMHLYVWAKTAGSGEPPPVFTATTGSYGRVSLYRLTGADAATPVDVTASDTATLDAPSVTTTGNDRTILHLFGSSSGFGTPPVVPAGDTQIESADDYYLVAAASHSEQSVAGPTGIASFDDSAGTTDQVTATVAIASATNSAPINLNDGLQLQWPGTLTAAMGGSPVRQDTGAGTVTTTGPGGPGDWYLSHYQLGGQTGTTYLRNGTGSPLSLTAPFTVALWEECTGELTSAKTWLKLIGTGADTIEVSQAADANPSTIPHKLKVGGVEQASDQRGTNQYNPSIWTLIVIRTDGAGNIEMRQNDAAFDAGTHTVSHEYDELQVAHITTDGMSWYVDEVAVWDRALTDAEVDHLWNAGVGQSYELDNYGPGSVEPLALQVEGTTPRLMTGAEPLVLSADVLTVALDDDAALTLSATACLPGVLQPAAAISLLEPGTLFGSPQDAEPLALQPVVIGPELPDTTAALSLQVHGLPPALPSVSGLTLGTAVLTGGLNSQPLILATEPLFGGLSHNVTLALGVAEFLVGPNELQPAVPLTLRVDATLHPRLLPPVESLTLTSDGLPGVILTPAITLAVDSLSDVPLLTVTPRLVLRADRFVTRSFERVNLIRLRSRSAKLRSLSVSN